MIAWPLASVLENGVAKPVPLTYDPPLVLLLQVTVLPDVWTGLLLTSTSCAVASRVLPAPMFGVESTVTMYLVAGAGVSTTVALCVALIAVPPMSPLTTTLPLPTDVGDVNVAVYVPLLWSLATLLVRPNEPALA